MEMMRAALDVSLSGVARILYQGGSEVWVEGLEYDVPQKLTHLLQCIGNL